jgi:hypothetical protein
MYGGGCKQWWKFIQIFFLKKSFSLFFFFNKEESKNARRNSHPNKSGSHLNPIQLKVDDTTL